MILFLLVVEAFSRLLSKAVDGGGFLVGGRLNVPFLVFHLLYDTSIFCGDENEQIGYLRCVLLCFEAVSRLKFFFGNSEMVPVGNVHEIERLASCWDVRSLLCL